MASTVNSEDESRSTSSGDWSATDLLDKLDGAVQSAIVLFDMLENVSADELNLVHLPSRLSKAWIWLVLFFASRGDASLETLSNGCMTSFKIAMEKSTSDFVNQSPRSELLQQSLMLPTDIGVLLSLQVLKDITTGQFDVVTIYEEYRTQLVSLMLSKCIST